MKLRFLQAAAWAACFVACGALVSGGSCGGDCEPAAGLPLPMTEARARELAPDVSTGLALSTTHVRGDCRPKPVASMPAEGAGACAGVADPDCARERAALRVFVVPVNVSVPVSEGCGGGFAAGDLAPHAVADRRASAGGELVIAVPAGGYRVYLGKDDTCAACGLDGVGAEACLVEVRAGKVTARDLVFDEATH